MRVSNFLFDVISTVGLHYGRRGQPNWLTRHADKPRQERPPSMSPSVMESPAQDPRQTSTAIAKSSRKVTWNWGDWAPMGAASAVWLAGTAAHHRWVAAPACAVSSRTSAETDCAHHHRIAILRSDSGALVTSIVDDQGLLRRLRWWSDPCWPAVAYDQSHPPRGARCWHKSGNDQPACTPEPGQNSGPSPPGR
jgi:hypothetical protein